MSLLMRFDEFLHLVESIIYSHFYTFAGPTDDIPVKVTGNVKAGFTAEFVPMEVGIQMVREGFTSALHSS